MNVRFSGLSNGGIELHEHFSHVCKLPTAVRNSFKETLQTATEKPCEKCLYISVSVF